MSVIDPTKAPIQFEVMNYIKDHCCMSASISVIGRSLGFTTMTFGTVGTAIRQLKAKGIVSEIKGRYHYYECENY